MLNICVLGSSFSWTRTLVNDLMAVFSEPLEIRFIDINPEAAQICGQWAEAAIKAYGRHDKVFIYTDRRKVLEGADAVLITLSTGGLDAMAQDISIPEQYGIFATVGDTAGPGGWSRSVRNIPVFMEFAEDFERICPRAFIANYTNPMSSLTATLIKGCSNPVSGFCHSYFEMKDAIQEIFNLPNWDSLSVEIAGMNHFCWITDFMISGQKGYPMLRDMVGGGSLGDVWRHETGGAGGGGVAGAADDDPAVGGASGAAGTDPAVGADNHLSHSLCIEFYDTYKYFAYCGDRHTCEFIPYVLTERPATDDKNNLAETKSEILKHYSIARTSIDERRAKLSNAKSNVLEDTKSLSELKGQQPPKSRETGAEMIRAYIYNQPFMDAVNTLNIGQIRGLPADACVETLGISDGLGIRPLIVNDVPEHLLEIMRPQAICQKWIVNGMIDRDKNLVMQALYRDPQCSHLRPDQIREMADKLWEANKSFIKW